MNHLRVIKDRTLGELVFECPHGIHVGSGTALFTKDIIRIKDNYVVIPMTSWKGIFRSLSTRLLNTIKKKYDKVTQLIIDRQLYNENERKLNITTADIIDLVESIGNREIKEKLLDLAGRNNDLRAKIKDNDLVNLIKNPDVETRNNVISLLTRYLSMSFPLTSLYGAEGLAGKLRFLDTFFYADLHIKTSVSIDRKTNKSLEGRLFNIVIAYPKDDIIKLRILIDNIRNGSDAEKQLIKSTLQYVKAQGIHIGGEKSRGIGYLKMIPEHTSFKTLQIENNKETLEKIAKPTTWPHKTIDEFLEWIGV